MPTKLPKHRIAGPGQAKRERATSLGRSIRNSYGWQKHRESIKATYGICRAPFHVGGAVVATEVHHILPVSEYPHLALDPTNTCPVCSTCHDVTKKMENKGQSSAHLFVDWDKSSRFT